MESGRLADKRCEQVQTSARVPPLQVLGTTSAEQRNSTTICVAYRTRLQTFRALLHLRRSAALLLVCRLTADMPFLQPQSEAELPTLDE